MNTINTARRTMFRTAGASILVVGSGGFIRPAGAVAPIIFAAVAGGILSSVVTGVFGLLGRKDDAAQNLENDRRAFEKNKRDIMMARVDYFYSQLPINEQLALFRDGTYYRALVSGNFDGFGSVLAVTDGKIHLARGKYGDNIHSDMATKIASHILPETGISPIPVKQFFPEDERINNAGAEYIADKKKMSLKQYNDTYTPSTITEMSLAQRPTANNSDFSFFTSLNKNETINIDGKRYAKVEVNPVPQKYLG